MPPTITITLEPKSPPDSNAAGDKIREAAQKAKQAAEAAAERARAAAAATADRARAAAAAAAEKAKAAAAAAADKARKATEAATAKAKEVAEKAKAAAAAKAKQLKDAADAAKKKAAEAAKNVAAAAAAAKAKQAEKKVAKQEAKAPKEEEAEEVEEETEEEEPVEEEEAPEEEVEEEAEEEESADGCKNTNQKIREMRRTGENLVVKLAPNYNITNVASFEEAFGESNLFGIGGGKMKAKRLTKKAANTKKIQQAKRDINDAKTETKVNKQANKGKKKVAKQAKGKVKRLARVDKRASTQQARIAKRGNAKQGRLANRDIGKDPELEEEELPTEETGSEEETEEEVDQSGEEGAEAEEGEQYEETGEEEEGGGEEEEEEAEEEFSGPHEYFDDIQDSESSFDGNEVSLEPNMNFEYHNTEGEVVRGEIHPKVLDCAKKIEWNKEKVARLESFCGADGVKAKDVQDATDKISHHKARAVELECQMAKYMAADGDDNSSAEGRVGKNTGAANAALREARKLRLKDRIGGARDAAVRKGGRSLTQIEQGLKPITRPGRIDIPARDESSAEGHETDQEENFSGKIVVNQFNWKAIAAGVLFAAAAIYAAKKYNWV